MANSPYVVPAELLDQIKLGLIALGYASESTPLSFVQDCYISYMLVRQVQLPNTNIPYALDLLPQELRDQLGNPGGGGGIETQLDGLIALVGDTYDLSPMTALHQAFLNGTLTNGYSDASVKASELAALDTEIKYKLDPIYFSYGIEAAAGITQSTDNTTYPNYTSAILTKKFLNGFKILNLTDAHFDKLKAGTVTAILKYKEIIGDMDINDSELPWTSVPLDMRYIYKWSGNYYYLISDNQLNKHRFMYKLDLDGTGTEYTEYSSYGGIGAWNSYQGELA